MPFAFRHQPLKAAYIAGGVVYVLAALPVWLVLDTIPAARPRKSWPFKRAILTHLFRTVIGMMFQTSLPAPAPLSTFEKNASTLGFVFVEATPELVVGEVADIAEKNGVKAERTGGFWYGPRDDKNGVGQRALPGERVVYHLHGGGYVMGSADPSGSMTELWKGYSQYLGPNLRMFALEYRISSAAPFKHANPFPASLIDTIAGYRYLIEDVGFEPRNIILSGDSAGGGIVFNLARYIATTDLASLPKPGGMILLSPTMDWAQTHVGKDSSMVHNSRSDVVQPILESGYTRRALVGRLPEEFAATSAWISPGALDLPLLPDMFGGFPPTAIVAGGAEYTLDPMVTVRDRLMKDNGKENVKYIEEADALHDFLVIDWVEPERTHTLKELGEWVKTL
ncbi:hypothetical protein GSI_11734 [Ganoderma sinense ZZ0214-1]|uniref:Alpha/beta hydrolase fold-3 domain-containing protein n=1 Tax=Ganoderma sinense ZZ0214-1 TaxID=1077348 RepID=A0A2G8RWU1_9APHY|nr:hypothetical protein GSI_11734 [Ganoderma sinense ZZ0214-1]